MPCEFCIKLNCMVTILLVITTLKDDELIIVEHVIKIPIKFTKQ